MVNIETNLPHETQTAVDLGDRFLAAWEKANGLTNSQVQVLTGDSCLVIIIEGALTRAERLLAEKENDNFLREYLDGLMHVISEEALPTSDKIAGQSVVSVGTDINLDQGWVMWYIKLDRI